MLTLYDEILNMIISFALYEVLEHCYTRNSLSLRPLNSFYLTESILVFGNEIMINRRGPGQWGDLLSSLLVTERVVQVISVDRFQKVHILSTMIAISNRKKMLF